MTDNLTEIIKEMRELLAKATPGNWEFDPAFGQLFIEPDYDLAAFDKLDDARLVSSMHAALPMLLDAAEKAERYEKALREIATTPYRIYDGNRPFVSDHDSGYATGVADGHRLAAKWASEALAQEPPAEQETQIEATTLAVKYAAESERYYSILRQALGYLHNAKVDLETGCPKKTALNTLQGGINLIENALKEIGR